jgi:hypothetical protein
MILDPRDQAKVPEQDNPNLSPQNQECLSPALNLMPALLKMYISETEAKRSTFDPRMFVGNFMVSLHSD